MDGGTLTIDNSTFSGNSAQAGRTGSAIFINNGTATLANSTFSGNVSSGGGGAVFNYGTLSMTNSILAGNTGGDGGGAFSGGNNLVGNGSGRYCSAASPVIA